MDFGEKLKRLRSDNGFTQEELAEKLYVTRTAISKWETGRGLPSIDSLKTISEMFRVSIDELISDSDIETKRAADEKRAKIMYVIAIVFLGIATSFAVSAYYLKQPYLDIGSVVASIIYVVFGLFSRPRYKRVDAKKWILPYIISRAVILIFIIGLIVFTIIRL